MSTIAESQPNPSASRANLRAYVAGGGASTALVAAAAVAFLTIAALVAFKGLPFGGDDDSGAAQIAGLQGGAPEAAAAAAAAAPGAVAATAAAPTPVALAPGGPGSPAGGEAGVVGPPGTFPPGGGPPGGGDPPGTLPAPSGGGTLGGSVGSLEQTAGSLGLDLPLTETTKGVTGPVDQTLEQTLNGIGGALNDVGGALGNPKLGSESGSGGGEVGSSVTGLADDLLE